MRTSFEGDDHDVDARVGAKLFDRLSSLALGHRPIQSHARDVVVLQMMLHRNDRDGMNVSDHRKEARTLVSQPE